jgi:uncharacterized membrane protein
MVIPILIISGLYAILPTIPQAHAAPVGEVCIAKNLSQVCPLTPPLINSTGPPAPQLRIGVLVNASDGFNAFEVILLTNSTFLKPAGYDPTNTVLKTPSSVIAHCIGNVGLGCGPADNSNTVHVAMASQGGLTGPPTTGLLFTAIYDVVGNTYSTPIVFQTGCGSQTSVSGGVCVTISSGTTTPLSEAIQTAKFTDRPYFDFQPIFPTISLTDPLGSTDTSLSLNVTSINNFQGTVNLAVSIRSTPPGITVTFSKNPLKVNITSPSNFQDFSGVTVTVASSATPGNYILNFTATSSPAPPNILLIPLTVPLPDYSITPNPGTLSFNVSVSASSQITLASLGNFAGRVNLTLSIPANIRASLQTASLVVPKGASISTTLTVNSTIAGGYILNITGVSTQLPPHKASVRINVLDYEMVTPTGTLVVPQGSSVQRAITVRSFRGGVYAVNVSISKIYVNQITSTGPVGPATGIAVGCFPTWANVTVTGLSSQPATIGCNVFGTDIGNYTVTVVGTSGRVSHAVTFPVIVPGPDFTIVPTPAIQTVDQGKSATVSLFTARQLGLVSNVTLSAIFRPGGTPPPITSFNVDHTLLDATHPNGTVIITVTAGVSTPIGVYTMLLTATAASTLQSHIITISIVVTTTTSPHDLAVLYVTPSSTSANIGSKIDITIEVANLGKANENSTVLALAQGLMVGQKNITLTPGQNINVTITWDTTGFNPGAYIITGQVQAVPGEGNKDNNLKSYATPVSLNPANTSVLQSPYFEPSIIAAIVAVVAIVAIFFVQSRRKTPVG